MPSARKSRRNNPGVAPWLIKGFQPGPAAVGVIATATGGAKAYPMLPYMGLLHTALRATKSAISSRAPRTLRRRSATSAPPTTLLPKKAAS